MNHLARNCKRFFGESSRESPRPRRPVLAATADAVCAWPPTNEVVRAWQNLILADHDIGRAYALHLIYLFDVQASSP